MWAIVDAIRLDEGRALCGGNCLKAWNDHESQINSLIYTHRRSCTWILGMSLWQFIVPSGYWLEQGVILLHSKQRKNQRKKAYYQIPWSKKEDTPYARWEKRSANQASGLRIRRWDGSSGRWITDQKADWDYYPRSGMEVQSPLSKVPRPRGTELLWESSGFTPLCLGMSRLLSLSVFGTFSCLR